MARIIDEGSVDKDDPMFTEGIKIISIRKQGNRKNRKASPWAKVKQSPKEGACLAITFQFRRVGASVPTPFVATRTTWNSGSRVFQMHESPFLTR